MLDLTRLGAHERVVLTPSGNAAIFIALQLCGKQKVIIPDQGGWLTYKKYPAKLGMELIEVTTKRGLMLLDELEKVLDVNSVLLYETPGGYFVDEPVEEIYALCKRKGASIILDISGAIGSEKKFSEFADFLVCSFGRWKPVNAEYGGFVSFLQEVDSNKLEDLKSEFQFDESKSKLIEQKLQELPKRREMLLSRREQVINELKDFNILFANSFGLVVVVTYSTEEEKEKILTYCKTHHLEWTQCPRYIRVNEDAISIEVKRL